MASSFSLDMKRIRKKIKGRERAFIQKLCLDIDSGLVKGTPVDTGTARSGWSVGINRAKASEPDSSKDMNTILREHSDQIKSIEPGDKIFLSNNVDYIKHLDDGTSDQAPNGIVDKTLQRFPGIIKAAELDAKNKNP